MWKIIHAIFPLLWEIKRFKTAKWPSKSLIVVSIVPFDKPLVIHY